MTTQWAISDEAAAKLRRVAADIVREHELFNMHYWAQTAKCGTACCIAGYLVANDGGDISQPWRIPATARTILGFDPDSYMPLFYITEWPAKYRKPFSRAAIGSPVAARIAKNRIEHFIATGE